MCFCLEAYPRCVRPNRLVKLLVIGQMKLAQISVPANGTDLGVNRKGDQHNKHPAARHSNGCVKFKRSQYVGVDITPSVDQESIEVSVKLEKITMNCLFQLKMQLLW